MTFYHRLSWTAALFMGIGLGKLKAELAEDVSEGEMLFALDVKPILASKCFSCHGDDPEEIEGGLDMTTLEGLLKGGESFDDVLIPGDSEFSFIMEAVRWKTQTTRCLRRRVTVLLRIKFGLFGIG